MLQLTDAARDAIRRAIDKAGRPVAGLRIMAQAGGCAGFVYGMALEPEAEADDARVEVDGLTVLLDPLSRERLAGATVDFVERVEGAGFVFDNPNATATCGCGKSFC